MNAVYLRFKNKFTAFLNWTSRHCVITYMITIIEIALAIEIKNAFTLKSSTYISPIMFLPTLGLINKMYENFINKIFIEACNVIS